MGHDLMAEEVEIDPFAGGSAFSATKQLPVKRARLGEIANGKCKVEAGTVHNTVVVFVCESEAPARVFANKRSRLCG